MCFFWCVFAYWAHVKVSTAVMTGRRSRSFCNSARKTKTSAVVFPVTDTSVGYNNLQYRIYEYHLSLQKEMICIYI